MDKAKIFLERHVQWLVLALAFLYVGYTAWQYVWIPPLTVDLPPAKNVKPGDIDDTIKTAKVVPLQREIDNKVVSAPKVTDVLTDFDDRLNEKRTEVVDMRNLWDAPFGTGGIPRIAKVGGPLEPVATLPVLPPAIFKASSTRRTVIMAPGRKDTAYWSGRFTIDANALSQAVAAAFAKPGIPPNLFQTEFASVELLREEQKPDGSWNAPVLIKPLPDPKYVLQDFPANNAPMKDWFDYRHWMDQNQANIAKPPFLTTAADAEPWLEPGALPPEKAPKRVPGQPAGAQPAGGPAAVAAPPAAGQPGPFNAIVQPADPTIIVHDITIEEGKTYRYAVRYKLYNPLFNNKVFAVPAVANQFAISGPDPVQNNNLNPVACSGPVLVEPSSYVFVTKINQFTGQASFDIFEWKDGRWHPTSVPVNKPLTAGDPISGTKGVSKYILVDVRKDTRVNEPNYVIVMDGTGVLQSRNVRDDGADAIYAKLKLQAGAAAVAK